MRTPIRILRESALKAGLSLQPLTPRQQAWEERLIAFATACFAEHGVADFSLARFACFAGVSPQTIVLHFCDLDALFYLILKTHIEALATALAAITETAPDRLQHRIQTYLAHTRSPQGTLTNPHLLLVRDREWLPMDLRQRIEPMRLDLGRAIAGNHAEAAIAALDDTNLTPDHISNVIHALLAIPPPTPPEDPALARERTAQWQAEAFTEWTKGERPGQVN